MRRTAAVIVAVTVLVTAVAHALYSITGRTWLLKDAFGQALPLAGISWIAPLPSFKHRLFRLFTRHRQRNVDAMRNQSEGPQQHRFVLNQTESDTMVVTLHDEMTTLRYMIIV